MKRKLFSKFISCVVVASCVLTASASIYTPGDDILATRPGYEYPQLGTYGWFILGGDVVAWDPSQLGADLLQWLTNFVSPDEVFDASDNATNAKVVGSPAPTFDGAGDVITMGDVWFTQNPHYKATIWIDPTSAGDEGIAQRRSASGIDVIFELRTKKIRFGIQDDVGGAFKQVTTDIALPDSTWMDAEGWYDRTAGANGTITLRYRTSAIDGSPAGSWVTKSLVSDTTLTLGKADSAFIGAYLTQKYTGNICDVQIWDYSTSTQLHGYPLNESSGLTVYDTVGSANGTITTGSGGLAAFWGSPQDVFHDFAENGGSTALIFEDPTTVSMSAATKVEGTKRLQLKARPTSTTSSTVFTSDSKSIVFEYVSGSSFLVKYGTDIIGGYSLGSGWYDFDLDVTLDSIIRFGVGANSFEIGGGISLEDNGGWQAGGLDGTTLYNNYGTDYPSMSKNNVDVRQYPSLSSGTDDVAGLGIQNPPETLESKTTHNGGLHKHKQTDVALLASRLYSSDGLTFDLTPAYSDYLQWVSYSDLTSWVKFNDDCFVSDVVLTEVLDADGYDNMYGWGGYGSTSCGSGAVVPGLVTSGGLGPDGTYATYDGTNIVFVIDE